MLNLYPKNTVDFTNNGDPIRYSFDEHVVRDEGFYLTFNLLLDKEEAYKKIKKEMIVSADTPDGINQFRIYDIKNKSTSVEVTAVQLMYDFDNKEVNPFSLKNATGSQVISRFKSSFKSTLGQFTMDSSVAETHDFATNDEDDDTPSHNALKVLNRITDRWDSELMLNGFDIRMIKRLGAKTDALLYEKKNISEFEDASSVSGMATRIHATSKFTPEGKEDEITLSVTVDSPLINEYAQIYEKSYVNNDAKTEAELIAWVKLKYSTENMDKPSRSITVSTNIIDGTEINYGDDLVLKYLVHDVDEIIRCVGYDYDPIKNTYYSVTLGDWKDSFATTLTGGIVDKTNQQLNQIKNNITYISMSANGKNRNAYGPDPVPNPINGDQWYYYEFDRPNDVEFRVYQDGFWVKVDFFATKKEVEDVLEQADNDRTKAEQEINQALTDAKNYTEVKAQEFNNQLLLVNQNVLTAANSANAAVLKAEKAIEDVGFMKVDLTAVTTRANDAFSTAQNSLTEATKALNKATAIETITGTLTTNYDALTRTVGLKADKEVVNTLNETVDKHTLDIKANAEGLKVKAESSLVNTIKGTVDNHTTELGIQAQAITARLTSVQVDNLLATKKYVNEAMLVATSSQWNLQLTQVETNLANKSDIMEQMTGAAGKVFKNPVSYNQNVQSITGYLIIKTPILSPFMSKVSISGYNYAGATSNIDLDVSFYAYTATQFVNFSYVNKGNFPIDSVKLARDSAGRTIIIIGKATTVWNYPKMQVVQAIIGQTNPPDSYKDGWSMEYSTDISAYTAQTNVTGPDYNTKITTIDVTVNGLQTTVANKAEQSQVTQLAGQVQTKVESATYNSKMTQLDSAINLRVQAGEVTAAILADKTVKDTRNDNQLPSWYNNNYARTSVTEFKLRTVMGLPGSATYVQVTTKSPWNGSSGGEIVQTAESSDGTYQRTSVGNLAGWSGWDKVAEVNKLITQINLSAETSTILIQGRRILLDGDVKMNAAFVTRLDALTLMAVYADIATLKTRVLTANVIDATMINTTTALITKLFATDANVNILTAKTAFINSVKAIDIAADRITAGTLNAALVNIINLNASRITTGVLSGITITSPFNYAYDGAIRNVGTTTIGAGTFSSIGTFTNSFGRTYMYINPDTIYAENIKTDNTVRSMFKLSSKGLEVNQLGAAASYTQDGIYFESGGGAMVKYSAGNARIEVSSYNGVGLGATASGSYVNRITMGGGNGSLDPFVDIWAPLTMRAGINMDGYEIRNVTTISGAQTIMFYNTSNRIVQGSDNILNIMSPVGIAMGYTNGSTTSNSLLINNAGTTFQKAVQFNGNAINGANNINGAQTILFHNSSNRIVQGSDGFLNILSPIQLSLGWTDGSSTFTTMIITRNQIVANKVLNMNGNSITNQSDRRLKKNIMNTVEDSLYAISQWDFVNYEWIDSTKPKGVKLGLIAQDTPELLLYDEVTDVYNVDSSKQQMMNSHAIQQLNQKVVSIDSLITATNSIANNAMHKVLQVDNEVQQMKNKIIELEKEIKTLKGAA